MMAVWRRERWAGNNGSEVMGVGKVAAAAIWRRSAQSRHRPSSEADARGPHGSVFFPKLSKPVQTWKLKIGALHCSKKFQCLHVAGLGDYEQFSQLCRHPILYINRAKNPGPDSTFESLMNFKRDLNLPKKSVKFSKILSWPDLHKSEFSWDYLYARIWVTIQVPNDVVSIK
jgi:hypothetical protein